MLFHEVVAVQRRRRHTCFKRRTPALLCREKRKCSKLSSSWPSLAYYWHEGETQVATQTSNKLPTLSWIMALKPKLTLNFLVSAKNVIRSSSKWQCHSSHYLVFVPWALHSPCASLRLVMTPKPLPANEIPLRSKVRGGLWCAKPFQYLRRGPVRRGLMRAHTCFLFANVHMMCKPFHPSAWHSWSVRTNPSKSLDDLSANFVPRSGLINLFMRLIKSYNA